MPFEIMDKPSNMDELTKLLYQIGLIDKLYAAIEKDDVSCLAITSYKILQDVGLMPNSKKLLLTKKSARESTDYRNMGNMVFTLGELHSAMQAYNKALKFAPKNSEEEILVLTNRSALLHKLKCFQACIQDIVTCLALECPDRIVCKLNRRKKDCDQFLWQDILMNKTMDLVDDYFIFSVKRHPEIACASTDIDVVKELGLPKIVAAKDIKVGTVIAIEQPFVTNLHPFNHDMACYYCHKFCLNLMPCDGCVVALFCSDDCREKCMDEYHSIECKVISVFRNYVSESVAHLAFKAALKIKSKCSWQEFIEATKKMGTERMRTAPIREIFDGKNIFSMLSYDDSYVNLVQGAHFNFSFGCAVILKALNEINYFPIPSEERLDAMQAFAKVLMNFRVMFPRISLGQTARAIVTDATGLTPQINTYLLAFSSRLKHSCEANALLLPLLNKVAVATQRPIKKGDEITISYVQNFYHVMYPSPHTKNVLLYRVTHSPCSCRVCKENWNVLNLKNCNMSPELRRVYHKWRRNPEDFKTTCQAMEAFDSMVNTKEHYEIYKQYIVAQNFNQYAATRNVLPEKLRPDSIPDELQVFK